MREILARPFAAAVAAILWSWLPTCAAEAAATPGVVVLDTLSVWRMHAQLAPPVLETGEKAAFSCRWMAYETPAAAADWMKPDYDDRFWHRGPLTLVPKTAVLSRACLRGKFTVTDPAAVEGLRLSATYNGGIIVYVNGKEIRIGSISRPAGSLPKRPGGEERKLVDCEVPAACLRKGMNVIALEIVRTAYPKEGAETGRRTSTTSIAATETGPAQGIPERPGWCPTRCGRQVLQVWPADPLAVDLNLDYGDLAEPLRPATILGTRNGLFSGKLRRGLVQTDSRAEGHRRRSGGPRRTHSGRGGANPLRQWNGASSSRGRQTRLNYLLPYIKYNAVQFNALAPEAPEQVAVKPLTEAWYREKNLPETVTPVPGAVVPVWVTVKVPADVKAGTYTGNRKDRGPGRNAGRGAPWKSALRIGSCRIRRTTGRGWT